MEINAERFFLIEEFEFVVQVNNYIFAAQWCGSSVGRAKD